MAQIATASITAQNTFSTATQLEGYFNLSISGTFVATVTVQRSPDNSTWRDVGTFTASAEEVGFEPEFMWYRVGVKTGEFVSGAVAVRIGRADKDRH